jgi:oxygen-independent coproporphyrinogen-3 oxidase
MILQLKRGFLDAGYFRQKFSAEILEQWHDTWQSYTDEGWVTVDGDRISLTRAGLVRADGLLPAFFELEHQGVRYT